MMASQFLALLAILGFILWRGRRLPLTGARKGVVLGCRGAAVLSLLTALWGPPHQARHELPRHILYLVDRSASLTVAQSQWITRRLASLELVRPKSLERAIVTFGGDAQLAVPFGREPLTDPRTIERLMSGAAVERDQTNLEGALLSALSFLPSSGRNAVVLFSDGRQTRGDVADIAPFVHRAGLDVFPVPTPLSENVTTRWEDLVVPPTVQRGSSVPLHLIVFNGGSRPVVADADVALHGVVVKHQRLALRPGWQVATLTVPAMERGAMAVDVRLAVPTERLEESRRAYTEVEGPPRLLFVTDRVTAIPLLASALKRREIDVTTARPDELPASAVQLSDYDAVVLFYPAKSAITQAQADALTTYVKELGGGLVTVGLGGDLAHEITTPSPLDPLLPVTFEPKGLREAKRRICMVLLIDRSASMIGPRIAATKQAAVALIRQLQPEDLVGVLAFDTLPYVISEVQPAGQASASIVEKLVKLHSTGGTDIYPALVAAANRLNATGATLKHIMLLSDGITPFHKDAYQALMKMFRAEGITVSTMGVGAAFINTDYLSWVAQASGGTFYQLRTLGELPQLVVRDTQQSLERLPFAEGLFQPRKSPTTDWFLDAAVLPSLRGYLTASARAGSRVDLIVSGGEGDDPLLARWSSGRGRVVSFLSDADARWSPEWVRWRGFDAAWAQVIRWAMRPRLTEELFTWIDENAQPPQLILEGELMDPRATLRSPEEQVGTIPLPLVQTGTWRWQASLEQVPSGWYQVSLESKAMAKPGAAKPDDARDALVSARRWVRVGAPNLSTELPAGQPPDEELLRRVARATSGAYDVPDRAFVPPTTTVTISEPPLARWLPIALILLLIEIALRGASML